MKEMVDKMYADGRTTMMSDGELKTMVKAIDPIRYDNLKARLKSKKSEN